MFGHRNLLKDGTQTDGVVLRNDTINNITKDRLTIGVKFDDGQTMEFTEDLTNYYEPPAHTLREFAGSLAGNNVIPVSLVSGSTIPVRYDPDDRRRLAIDVPALLERVVREWTTAQAEQRSRAEALLAAQAPGGLPSAASSVADESPPEPDPDADKLEAEIESVMKLDELHKSGSLSDEEYAAAKHKLLDG